ncbi:MAG: hypothetical protein ABFC97_05780 [Anaerolineaceae bacterium]
MTRLIRLRFKVSAALLTPGQAAQTITLFSMDVGGYPEKIPGTPNGRFT